MTSLAVSLRTITRTATQSDSLVCETVGDSMPGAIAVAASSFIYIAVADLIPGLHKRAEVSATVQQVVLIASGVIVIYLTHSTLH